MSSLTSEWYDQHLPSSTLSIQTLKTGLNMYPIDVNQMRCIAATFKGDLRSKKSMQDWENFAEKYMGQYLKGITNVRIKLWATTALRSLVRIEKSYARKQTTKRPRKHVEKESNTHWNIIQEVLKIEYLGNKGIEETLSHTTSSRLVNDNIRSM